MRLFSSDRINYTDRDFIEEIEKDYYAGLEPIPEDCPPDECEDYLAVGEFFRERRFLDFAKSIKNCIYLTKIPLPINDLVY